MRQSIKLGQVILSLKKRTTFCSRRTLVLMCFKGRRLNGLKEKVSWWVLQSGLQIVIQSGELSYFIHNLQGLLNPYIAMTELISSYLSGNTVFRCSDNCPCKSLVFFISSDVVVCFKSAFDDRERVFNRIEVWRVWRKVFEFATFVFN